MRTRRWSAGLVLGLSLFPLTAEAHWRTTRGGPTRTGVVDGSGNFGPSVTTRWKRYLGGEAAAGSFVTNAKGDVAYLARAEHLRATKLNDSAIWETPLFGVREVVGVADLNGDGKNEVVAVSKYAGRVMVFDALSGALLWATDVARFRKYGIGTVRLRDVTGDGHPELYVSSRGSGSLDAEVFADVYGFSGGVPNATTLLTIDLSTHDYDYGENEAWADLDGDGKEELFFLGNKEVYGYSVGSGLVAQGDVGTIPYAKARTLVADVDGDGDDEVILFSNPGYPAAQNSRRVAVVELAADGTTLQLLWSQDVSDVENDRHYFTGEAVVDLDGDGALELVGSFYEAAQDAFVTHVWSAATGLQLATLPGVIAGVADADGDGSPEILVSPAEDAWGLSAYRWTAGLPELEWTLLDRRLAKDSDPLAQTRQSAIDRTVLMDVDGDDGRQELVLVHRHPDESVSLDAYDTSSGDPVLEASYALPVGVAFGAFQRVSTPTGDELFVSRSDGFLAVLKGLMLPINEVTYGTGVKLPGIRTGGYFTGFRGVTRTLLTGELDASTGKDELLVRDSRGALLALDPSSATLSKPPAVLWEQLNDSFEPALVDVDGDGQMEVVTGRRDAFVLRSGASGQALWEKASPDADAGFFVGADVDGDGDEEIVVATRSLDNSMMRYTYLSGAGAALWNPLEINGNLATGLASVGDFTGDGVADLVAHPGNNLIAADGATGALLYQGPAGMLSMMPILADLDSDGVYEHVYANGFSSNLVGFTANASGLFVETVAPNDVGEYGFYQYGAFVECPSGIRQIYATQNSPRVRVVDPTTGTNLFDAFLAAGAVHASLDDALAASTAPPYVGNVNAVTDLAGDGEPRLMAPSADGNLYVLHACAAGPAELLEFAVDFGVPVSEAIPADVDADPELEILVTTLDGELRCLDLDWLAAQLSPQEGQGVETELDEIETFDAVPVRWQAVPGATSYEVGVFDQVGGAVVPFHAVDGLASVEVGTFVLDAPYTAYVRAIGPDGVASFEQSSDGFRRVDLTPPVVTFGPAVGDPPTQLPVQADDLTGLVGASAQLVDATGAVVREVTFPASGPSSSFTLSVAGVPPGDYTVRARADDVGGHTSEVEIQLKLGGGLPPVVDAAGSGCVCSAAPAKGSAGSFVLLLGLLPLLRRRASARSRGR